MNLITMIYNIIFFSKEKNNNNDNYLIYNNNNKMRTAKSTEYIINVLKIKF